MRVVEAERFGGPEVLRPAHRPDPQAGPGEALVEVAASDVMFLDAQLRSGWGQEYFRMRPPYVPGSGVVGRVVSVGAGADPGLVGAEVLAETGRRDPETLVPLAPTDGYAELVATPARHLVRLPRGLDGHVALSLLHDGPTALQIAEAARFSAGDRVLVNAAAGGAGSLLVQLAAGAGARVVGAARGPRKLALARELGAEAVVDYSEPDWTSRVREATSGKGPDVVLDGAGGSLGRDAFAITARGGHLIAYGASGGDFADTGAQDAAGNGVRVTGLFDLPAPDADGRRRRAEEALAEAAAGRFWPTIGQTFRLDEAGKAHAAIASRTTVGKTLLVP
ncbi:zinc-binding dehydrogenase [Streptomonospora wellingtoniae]|uniref:Zinc-binding dehydrogenase n=1 Tax=Streptomonospora wellingtoniae TaxID=3075544 RepID=A0ABU2KQC4_9ACTN|nr:zinc-binding dehydrogenase [Streptomonospora sp. DSM 45055]MDT0301372.1 zinc-binding dehydrogenase [Streptomonospora sp. DSM 45055]